MRGDPQAASPAWTEGRDSPFPDQRLQSYPLLCPVTACVDRIIPSWYCLGKSDRLLAAPLQPPAGYNHTLPQGQWLPLSQWRSTSSGHWMIIPRLEWLAPVRTAPTGHAAQQLAEQLERRFGSGGRPQLLAALDEAGNERSRCFVAPDSWPNLQN
ncbi:DUF1853 family protein [Haliea sp.]|uniref:DUF1853 family protein n=1 Tax=Haliea sp. TaxID=1932666 RepID=UPI003527690F